MEWLMILFWLCAALVVYHHVGYPLLLSCLGKRASAQLHRPAPRQRDFRQAPDDAALPAITLVMPVYNEAVTLAAKLQNLASLDYPADKLEWLTAPNHPKEDMGERKLPFGRELYIDRADFREHQDPA